MTKKQEIQLFEEKKVRTVWDADTMYVNLYHLKFAINKCTSRRIDNFYEVCGQAEKSGLIEF